MKILMNMVNHESKLNWFHNDWHQLATYLKDMKLDGTELIFHQDYNVDNIPQELAVGIHMTYWPTWLDFWRGNKEALKKQFLNMENVAFYYGDFDPTVLIKKYQQELKTALELKMEYAVVHVSHVEVEDTYTWDFKYSDEEVLDATAEFINATMEGMDPAIALLFENLWWPGLNFKDPEATAAFFEKIHYPNKGFMLDIGHLMITNPLLRDLEEAGAYILEVLKQNQSMIPYIRGIHLNQALTGQYVSQDHGKRLEEMRCCDDYWDMLGHAREHIGNIDQHTPFGHGSIRDIIALIQPDFLVYEFLPEDRDSLTKMILFQHQVLGISL
ncbi:TIM barrel protein [Alkalibacter rhizosphaerae]|uniref:TIM barrel protein n=1 Tax=Alkalibacter rhizosphaerae TaxID=2815577 RepID=A0A974XEH2_9FIRM|nr:TIM barrel protein [Alkalibacter rhizosphaerae]QSX08367.1 TIM barrel protein [Alkalibacter rhizosphaerae]